ncbi:hypothetical protein CDAR_493801 [Caerostris darwini]|uniref:Ribosomal protein S14 n=1 Tax=Caerostris darwini TaxID=1538125 RepID=A0AAV4VUZ9_9ARAC|nr:hypothetical protein CDAR_493801 [Caerostris darwini]
MLHTLSTSAEPIAHYKREIHLAKSKQQKQKHKLLTKLIIGIEHRKEEEKKKKKKTRTLRGWTCEDELRSKTPSPAKTCPQISLQIGVFRGIVFRVRTTLRHGMTLPQTIRPTLSL